MPSPDHILLTLLVIFAVTYALRLAPFLALRRVRDSALVSFLGRTMPLGVMAILVVYTLSSVDLTAAPHGLPELAGVVVTAALHLWRRNALLSIVGGTGTYMAVLALL
ncbi:branched-chain amino acid transporter permease [Georgenia thermotolerans]|uniref:Branched-chain amino acid ABC transporter n=1 Tax=Georgenia thermotolerans TaxID=527326 RepID=A0A7J5UMV9_9MICO|nr:AzlD domain-containing protein [Georgenia thermotolerans]KAE8763687.1 branched-chain amino acid ABC transporter [Georgenia thermotolerans]